MNSELMDYVKKQVDKNTPDAVISIIATQLARAADAKKRIEEEGLVVRDIKGSVIPHPAIKIEIEAGRIVADLISKNKSKW